MVSCEGNTAIGGSAALDCGSEDGEPARKTEHAHARRGIKLAGMNFECARRGQPSARSHSRYPVFKEFRYALLAYLDFVPPPDGHRFCSARGRPWRRRRRRTWFRRTRFCRRRSRLLWGPWRLRIRLRPLRLRLRLGIRPRLRLWLLTVVLGRLSVLLRRLPILRLRLSVSLHVRLLI